MGTDTPLAVLSERPKLLFNYFKQLFAQVTNPPIDPFREGLVMSLMTFTGKQRNLFAETPEHCRQLKLAHPILTNEDLERLRSANRPDFKVVTLSMLFKADAPDPAEAIVEALDNLVETAAAAINEGASLLIISDRGISPNKAAIPSLLAVGGAASWAVEEAAAERGGHHRRKRRAARGDALLHVVRLWRERHQSLSGLRGDRQTPCRGRFAARRARRSIRRSIHHRGEKGHFEDDVEDGHLDLAELLRRDAVRSRRPQPRGGR